MDRQTHAVASQESPVLRRQWTDDEISRFWEYWSSREDRDSWHFSHFYGPALVNFARWSQLLKGEVLDYGFARGTFLPYLLDSDVQVTGVEFSQRAVTTANERFGRHPNWRGAVSAGSMPTPLPDNHFDLIFGIEVVEHLTDAWFDPTLAELYRLTKPGGHVILTTPNAENLDAAEVLCPFCGSLFHPVQHMRSVTPAFLQESLSKAGFDVVFCRGISLNPFQKYLRLPSPAEWSPAVLSRVLGLRVLRLLDRLAPRPAGSGWAFDRAAGQSGAHLCAIARKPAASLSMETSKTTETG